MHFQKNIIQKATIYIILSSAHLEHTMSTSVPKVHNLTLRGVFNAPLQNHMGAQKGVLIVYMVYKIYIRYGYFIL